MKIETKSLENLNKKLDDIGKKLLKSIDQVPDRITQTLSLEANEIRNEILLSMRSTPKGREYLYRGAYPGEDADIFFTINGRKVPFKKRWKPHFASLPGRSPAIDTGELVSRIMFDVRSMEVEVGAEAGASYGIYLEKGTKSMEARPFVGPAVDKRRTPLLERIGKLSEEIMGNPFK